MADKPTITNVPNSNLISVSVEAKVTVSRPFGGSITNTVRMEFLIDRYTYENNPDVKAALRKESMTYDDLATLQRNSVISWSTPNTKQKYYESFWETNDAFFDGLWWHDESKFSLATTMLMAEANAHGSVFITDISLSSNPVRYRKMSTIDELCLNTAKTGELERVTLDNLENFLGKAWNYDHKITEEHFKTLIANYDQRPSKEFSKFMENGGSLILDGLMVLLSGAVYVWAEKLVAAWSQSAVGSQGVGSKVLNAGTKADALKSVDNLPSGIQSKVKDFFKGGSNSYIDFSVETLGNGNYVARMVKPGDVPGSKAIYYKEISPGRHTIRVFKETFDPFGNLVHIKDK